MMTLLRKGKTAAIAALLLLALSQTAQGEEPWQASFEQTCSRTSEAMTLSVDELKTLVGRCDALQKIIETQQDSVRKVYLKRLQLCRNLYTYMLDYKTNQQSSK